jgi:hypothetical protein
MRNAAVPTLGGAFLTVYLTAYRNFTRFGGISGMPITYGILPFSGFRPCGHQSKNI